MSIPLVITNGSVLHDGTLSPLDIAVAGGRVVALGVHGAFPDAVHTLDARGLLVLPGAVDSHFHVRGPAHPERETFATATQAAAAGGVTTIIEMPIASPPAINGASVQARMDAAAPALYVDIGFYSSCATGQRDDLTSAIAVGALAFKAFLQSVPPGREDEFNSLCLPTNRELLAAFQLLREFDLPCVFHPEDEAMLQLREAQLKAAGRRDGLAHAEARPDYVEAVSVGTLLRLAEAFGVHLHVPHVSAGMTAHLIREAKARGVRVTAETCPHYLAFDSEALARLGPYAKCNPPLKTAADRDALWDAVRDGTIDTLASDHAPFTVVEKERAREDIWLAPPGFPGSEVLVPYAVGAALTGELSWARVTEMLYTNPAHLFGLWPRKGSLAPGADADIVLYDPHNIGVFDHHTFHTKAAATALIWDGVPRTGAVTHTLLRGETVFADGAIVGQAGAGRVQRRGN